LEGRFSQKAEAVRGSAKETQSPTVMAQAGALASSVSGGILGQRSVGTVGGMVGIEAGSAVCNTCTVIGPDSPGQPDSSY
jgi:hypothetical protein